MSKKNSFNLAVAALLLSLVCGVVLSLPARAADEAPAQLFLVIMHHKEAPSDAAMDAADTEALLGHITYLNTLYDKGALVLAGPFTDDSGDGLGIYKAASIEEVQAMVEADPSVGSGIMELVAIHPFWDAFNAPEGRRFTAEDMQQMMSAAPPEPAPAESGGASN